ncbi:unnamed protein product [Cylicostephanus goldi]|uniref:Uncharacterized protein n=1 Tax=Cylicostephanus goldi TaxID=71465 RepID=A0A3P6SMD0_CYLGO|nr:unnamed protein product [Cylicostephanus goldi]
MEGLTRMCEHSPVYFRAETSRRIINSPFFTIPPYLADLSPIDSCYLQMSASSRGLPVSLVRNRSIDDFNEQVVNMLDEVEKRVEQLR